MDLDYRKLSPIQLDALKEVGNIGAAHAATALSQIIEKTIMITVSRIEIVPIGELCKVVGGAETQTAVVRMHILGDIRGEIILALAKDDALSFADVLKGSARGTTTCLDEVGESAIKEAGSILAASYLKAIGDFLKVTFIPSVPGLMHGRMGAILKDVFTEVARRAEIAFCIETEFIEASSKIEGHFILMPDVKSMALIFKALGVSDMEEMSGR